MGLIRQPDESPIFPVYWNNFATLIPPVPIFRDTGNAMTRSYFVFLPRFGYFCRWILVFAAILLCCSVVSAASFSRVQVTTAPNFVVVTTSPTPVPTPQTAACQAPCECLYRPDAVAKWGEGEFSQCAELPCSYSAASNVAGAMEKHCYKQKATLITSVTFVPVTTTPTPSVSFAQVTLSDSVFPVATTKLPIAIVTVSPLTDGDSIPMTEDNCPFVTNEDQKDSEPVQKVCSQNADTANSANQQGTSCQVLPKGDGVGDACDNCPLTHNKDQNDSDNDGLGDTCDLCPSKPAPDGWTEEESSESEWGDEDGDKIGYNCDNCRFTANPDQKDSDLGGKKCTMGSTPQDTHCYQEPNPDGIGDACDNCPAANNPKQEDDDNDKVGNLCDNCRTVANTDQLDTNHDGQGDACDCNDGITGPNEVGPDDGVLCPPIADCVYCGQYIKPIYLAQSPEKTIDIIFVPSSTTWDVDADTCRKYMDTYTKDEVAFKKVAQDAVANWYWKMDTYSVNSIPADYRHRINFYYYWRPGKTADMCGSCAGDLPDTFWTDASFADVGAILYPPRGYGKEYAGGCADKLGPTKSHFKAPGWVGWGKVMLHESGHAVFSLVDTYCGDTYYEQNDPFTNVWSSETACKNDIKSKGGDQSQCRQILADDPNTAKNPDCSKSFWKWDPDPDLMHDHWNGNFGPRDVRKINYIFQTYTSTPQLNVIHNYVQV